MKKNIQKKVLVLNKKTISSFVKNEIMGGVVKTSDCPHWGWSLWCK